MLQSQGGHDHHHHEDSGMNFSDGHHLHDEPEENLDAVWKGLTALGGVYFMFLIEHFLTLGKMYKDKKQKVNFFVCLVIKTEMKWSELHVDCNHHGNMSLMSWCCCCGCSYCYKIKTRCSCCSNRSRRSGITMTKQIQRSSLLWKRTT